jgi:2-polyprenyl-3-methyl-5-hydroxy-6-metoxy-1,4-benzoquinol methylase
MSEFWEDAFVEKQLMWGEAPAKSALWARDFLVKKNARSVLIPGVGYGRNAKPFLDAGMSVAGIEISETAIRYARERMKLTFPIHHGSVGDMPYDDARYDAVFSHGLVHLLDEAARAKFVRDSLSQLGEGGHLIFTVVDAVAKSPRPVPMTFFDGPDLEREFGPCEYFKLDDHHPFYMVIKPR